MGTAFLIQALKPFMLFIVLLPAIPITMAVKRWMRDGKLKRTLLDRTLVDRRPWIGWAFAIGGILLMIGMGALGTWIHHL